MTGPGLASQQLQHLLEGLRRRGLKSHGLAGTGMNKGEPVGMKHLGLKTEGIVLRPVDGVPQHRVLDIGQVDPDLVGPAGM